MEQATESGDISIRDLGGLNQRQAPLSLPPNEFSVLQGLYPSQQGSLSRLPGKEKLFQLEGRVLSIHPTYNSSGHVLIQTDEHLYLSTVDEIMGRTVSTSLTANPDPDPGGTSTGDISPPTAPSNLAISSIASGSLTLSWTASVDNVAVTSYSIYYKSSGAYSLYGTSTVNTLSIIGLTASTAYTFKITASDAAGNISNDSLEVSATTTAGGGDVTAPAAPGNLIKVSSTTTSITVSWDASTDDTAVIGYNVYSRVGSSGSFTQAGTTTTLSFAASSLTPNTEYNFQVKAFDAAGNISSASNTLSAFTDDSGVTNPVADEVLIYYKKSAGVDGNGVSGAGLGGIGIPITDVVVPVGKTSFTLAVNAFDVSIPSGTYAFEIIQQVLSTGTNIETFIRFIAGTTIDSNTHTSPASDISSLLHTLNAATVTSAFSVSAFVYQNGGDVVEGKNTGLGEDEIYMILKITKLL